jgi:predicted RNA-binding protein associated with RNAse of E/G family
MPTGKLPRPIDIVYRRLPNDVREIPGILRQNTPARLVIESAITVDAPRQMSGRVIVDSGYLAIWFVYRDKWYDVGKIYDRARNWVGYYCDIIRPVGKLLRAPTRTNMITDLFLDLWITPEGRSVVMDEDEFENALRQGYLSKKLANQTRREMDSLIRATQAGKFPSPSVQNVKPL